jgi:hypothetical protein
LVVQCNTKANVFLYLFPQTLKLPQVMNATYQSSGISTFLNSFPGYFLWLSFARVCKNSCAASQRTLTNQAKFNGGHASICLFYIGYFASTFSDTIKESFSKMVPDSRTLSRNSYLPTRTLI